MPLPPYQTKIKPTRFRPGRQGMVLIGKPLPRLAIGFTQLGRPSNPAEWGTAGKSIRPARGILVKSLFLTMLYSKMDSPIPEFRLPRPETSRVQL
jgi:hypothetical protein